MGSGKDGTTDEAREGSLVEKDGGDLEEAGFSRKGLDFSSSRSRIQDW